MKRISSELRESIIQKALLARNQGLTLQQIAHSHHVGYSTVHKWLKKYKELGRTQLASSSRTHPLTSAQRFEHLLATATLDAVAVGVYCREQGLYSHQLQQWKDDFMTQNPATKEAALQAELKALRAENKTLKKDLHRKDKALAETTALLVLKKKAQLLWGDPEDD
jgi:transposase-like protein